MREKINIFGIAFLLVGLSFSRAFVSLSYVILIANWLIDRDVLKKFNTFFHNPIAVSLASIYFIHLIGLLYTSDFNYAFLEIRTKVPLLIFPLIFSTTPPPKTKVIHSLLLIFSLSVVASWATAVIYQWQHQLVDPREAFRFVSHIRLSLMAVMAISIFIWFIQNKQPHYPKYLKLLWVVFIGFLLWAITIMEVMSGWVLLLGVALLYALIMLLGAQQKIYSWGTITIIALIMGFFVSIIYQYTQPTKDEDVKTFTQKGNTYSNLEDNFPIENGSHIGRNICWTELKEYWNNKSLMSFDSLDERGNRLKYTLLRYLNSLHYSKDAHGIAQLNARDIRNIEKGFANIEYTKTFSFKKRIYKLLWEYNMYHEHDYVQKSSMIKRLVLWQTAIHIIKDNPLIGVGTGDVKNTFATQLEIDKSPLAGSPLRAHNQYLSIAIAFGIPVALAFLIVLFYPLFRIQNLHFIIVVFALGYFISMLWEDSLETQIGLTIFAFFYPFFLFWFQKDIEKSNKGFLEK